MLDISKIKVPKEILNKKVRVPISEKSLVDIAKYSYPTHNFRNLGYEKAKELLDGALWDRKYKESKYSPFLTVLNPTKETANLLVDRCEKYNIKMQVVTRNEGRDYRIFQISAERPWEFLS